MIAAGILNLGTDRDTYKGFPVYDFVAYIALIGGVAILVLAWLLRSPSRTEKKDK
jgi:hypothetical protein